MRWMTMLAILFIVSGCATTQTKVPPAADLQKDIADMQQRMEEQEKEIVDLKYEVKELSGKSPSAQVVPFEESSLVPSKRTAVKIQTSSADSLIKVNTSAENVQKALKGAGLYEGKIDGKLGSKTKAAIMEFQKQHNLKADGVIGQKTWSELKTYMTE